ncbi:MAG: M35 family metallo-endopeptidase [Vitreoscilla sp.]
MVDWNRKFRSEYDAVREVLASPEAFEPDWQPVVAQLARLLGLDGFDVGRAEALDELRRRATHACGVERVDEAEGLLRAVGPGTDGSLVADDARRRAAALKLLRHVHLEGRAGSRGTWIVALPSEFTDWPSSQFHEGAATVAGARQLLAARVEHFDVRERRWLGAAVQQGLGWCQRATMVLADARRPRASASAERERARALVRRWFVEAEAAEAVVDKVVATLARGFKDIVAALNRGRFVITDWVPLRAASTGLEVEFLRTEAFAFRARSEGMDVVYVEGAFFDDVAGNVLRGQANWTRILVHELSHLVCGTHDVNDGQSRYAWAGIGPHAGYPSGATIRNADNWAFFAADCAGALTAGQRTTALRRT